MDIRKAIEEKRYEEIIAYLRPISNQGNYSASNDLAITYRHMGNQPEELFYAARAFEQNRLSGVAIFTLQRALQSQGAFQSASRLYREVQNDRIISRNHHINGALSLIRINRVYEAAVALERAGGFPSANVEDLKIELLMARALLDHQRAHAILDRLSAQGEDIQTQRTSQFFASGDMAATTQHFDDLSGVHNGVKSQAKVALQAAIASKDIVRVNRYLQLFDNIPISTVKLAEGIIEGRELIEVRGTSRNWKFPFVPTNLSVALPHVVGEFYEYKYLEYLKEIILPGSNVIDIGANIGNHTVYFAGEANWKVIPFECNPGISEKLRQTVSMNDLSKNIDSSYIGYAISDRKGEIPFRFVRDDYSFLSIESDSGTISVPCIKLDDVKLDSCALVKIDVDGGEKGVLAGARAFLSQFRPIVAIEVMNFNMRDVLSYFDNFGYRILREDSLNEAHSDFVFAPCESKLLLN